MWLTQFGFAEEDATGCWVKNGDVERNIPRLSGESIEDLVERAVAAVPRGDVIVGKLYTSTLLHDRGSTIR